jgi:glycosyltransferase family protein
VPESRAHHPATIMSRATLPDFMRGCGLRALAAFRVSGGPLRVADEWATLRTLCERRASIARYGDGELEIMIGRAIRFQEYDPELARRLRAILRRPSEQFLVGIPNFSALRIERDQRRQSWERYRLMFSHLVSRGAEYHSAFVSRPSGVIGLVSTEYFQAFESLWSGRHVVLIHNSAATTGHPLFRQASRISHIPCPAQQAFRDYSALLESAAAFLAEPGVIFLIAAGPTACVLAWDLAQRGAQALDIGHLTNGYDHFIKQ